MKRKHLFLLAFSLLFVVFSCALKDNVVDISRKLPQEPQPPATSGNTITMDSLRSLALNLPAIFSQQPQTRSTGENYQRNRIVIVIFQSSGHAHVHRIGQKSSIGHLRCKLLR